MIQIIKTLLLLMKMCNIKSKFTFFNLLQFFINKFIIYFLKKVIIIIKFYFNFYK